MTRKRSLNITRLDSRISIAFLLLYDDSENAYPRSVFKRSCWSFKTSNYNWQLGFGPLVFWKKLHYLTGLTHIDVLALIKRPKDVDAKVRGHQLAEKIEGQK